MQAEESHEVSGHFDEDIHRCPREDIFTGSTFWDQILLKIANLHAKSKKTDF